MASQPGTSPAGAPVLPDTPEGRQLAEWLVAFNAEDPDALLAYHRAHSAPEWAESRAAYDLVTRRAWGVLVPHSVVPAETGVGPTEIEEAAGPAGEEHPTARPGGISLVAYAALIEDWVRVEVAAQPSGPNYYGPAFATVDVPPPPRLADDELVRELGRYVDKLAAADAFSGAVLVARDGKVLFTAAHGTANRAPYTPNELDTRFNLASMGKMFTAVAVAQLAERGDLAFDDRVGALLPDYPNREVADRVAVHHLLTHTSGVGDPFRSPDYKRLKDGLRAVRDWFPLFADQPLQFEPGERHQYSNGGFILLGAIVEAVAGQDYFAYVHEHVFRPAGMDASGFFERGDGAPDAAVGYTYPLPDRLQDMKVETVLAGRADNAGWLAAKGSPAGGCYSTVGDLLKFDAAVRSHALVGPETTGRLITGMVETPFGPTTKYGYGFYDERVEGWRLVGHGGGAPGISGKLDTYLAAGTDLGRGHTVVVLSNYDEVGEEVARRAMEWLIGRNF